MWRFNSDPSAPNTMNDYEAKAHKGLNMKYILIILIPLIILFSGCKIDPF